MHGLTCWSLKSWMIKYSNIRVVVLHKFLLEGPLCRYWRIPINFSSKVQLGYSQKEKFQVFTVNWTKLNNNQIVHWICLNFIIFSLFAQHIKKLTTFYFLLNWVQIGSCCKLNGLKIYNLGYLVLLEQCSNQKLLITKCCFHFQSISVVKKFNKPITVLL